MTIMNKNTKNEFMISKVKLHTVVYREASFCGTNFEKSFLQYKWRIIQKM